KTALDLEAVLRRVFDQYQKHDDREINNAMKADFIFHMTDWVDDLNRLQKLINNPGDYSQEQAGDIVACFLLHATSHIKAAASLLLDFDPIDFELPHKGTPVKQTS